MQEMKKPADVNSLMTRLISQGIIVNQSTIYRILSIFIEHNLVRPIQFQEGKARYELAALPHHHHAVCTNCGLVEDINSCDIHISPSAQKNTSFSINSHSLEFFGLCTACRS